MPTIERAAQLFLVLSTVARTASGQLLHASGINPPSRCSIVQVFGDAAVRNVVSQPGDRTSATGSLGMRYFGTSWIAIGSISAAGRSDTVRQGFGASLLPPASGRAFDAGLIDLRLRRLPVIGKMRYGHLTGFRLYGSAASSIWATDTSRGPPRVYEVPVWGLGAGLYYQFFGGTINDSNQVAMVLDAGFATRRLRGDLFADSPDTTVTRQRRADRRAFLGTGSRNFNGLEIGLGMQFNILNAGLTYYYFPDKQGRHVDGFSGGQVVAGISIRAVLASDWLVSSVGRDEDRRNEPAEPAVAGSSSDSVSRQNLARTAASKAPPRETARARCARLANEARTGFVAPQKRDTTATKPDSAAVKPDSAAVKPDTTAVRPDGGNVSSAPAPWSTFAGDDLTTVAAAPPPRTTIADGPRRRGHARLSGAIPR